MPGREPLAEATGDNGEVRWNRRFGSVRTRPTALATLIALIIGSLALLPEVANAYVYWTDPYANTIGRANLDGTGAKENFITGTSYPRGIAVDASHLYWANSSTGTIGRANLDGSNVNQSFIAGASSPQGVAVDADHIYWSNGQYKIGRANLDGSNVDQNFISDDDILGSGIAVDGGHIYWANQEAGSPAPTSTARTSTSTS